MKQAYDPTFDMHLTGGTAQKARTLEGKRKKKRTAVKYKGFVSVALKKF